MKKLLSLFSIKIGPEAVGRNDFLKIVAIVSMAIDHVGAIFFPMVHIYRIIGRLALPVFAIGIAEGYFYTRNIKKYLLRIFLVGVFSQYFYGALFGVYKLNILFSFFAALLALWAWNRKNFFVLAGIGVLVYYFHFDYGFYGMAMIALYYFLREKRAWLVFTQGINVALNTYFVGFYLVAYQMLGVFLTLYFPKKLFHVNINRYYFYWFYPAQLIVIWLVKEFII